jgi:hypothetical protein
MPMDANIPSLKLTILLKLLTALRLEMIVYVQTLKNGKKMKV